MKAAKDYEKFLNNLDALTSRVFETRAKNAVAAQRVGEFCGLDLYEKSVVEFSRSVYALKDFARDSYLRRDDE